MELKITDDINLSFAVIYVMDLLFDIIKNDGEVLIYIIKLLLPSYQIMKYSKDQISKYYNYIKIICEIINPEILSKKYTIR